MNCFLANPNETTSLFNRTKPGRNAGQNNRETRLHEIHSDRLRVRSDRKSAQPARLEPEESHVFHGAYGKIRSLRPHGTRRVGHARLRRHLTERVSGKRKFRVR